MGEITSEIERDIVTERSELGRNLEELETKARALADWRTHYRNHAGLALGVVFGTAVVAGALIGRNRAPRVHVQRLVDPRPERVVRPSEPKTPREPSRYRRHLEDTWQNVTAALLGVATAKAIDVVSDMVPGFRDHYGQRSVEAGRVGYAGERFSNG